MSVRDAARLLGKSERQVRHLVSIGKIKARKDGVSWRIKREDLVLTSSSHVQTQYEQMTELKEHVVDAIDQVTPKIPVQPGPIQQSKTKEGKRDYSLSTFKTFQKALNILIRLRDYEHSSEYILSAKFALQRCLHALSDGFHQFHSHIKREKYILARSAACEALADLHVGAIYEQEIDTLINDLENELLGLFRGLMIQIEKNKLK